MTTAYSNLNSKKKLWDNIVKAGFLNKLMAKNPTNR